MGLFDINMSTPEGEGFNNALMQAAAMLLTPRARGGGIGSAFAAMPQAIQQAQAQAQRNRLMGLQEQQVGMQGQKLQFDMDQAASKQQREDALRTAQQSFWQRNGGRPVDARMIAEGQMIGIKPDDLKAIAESPNWGKVKLAFQNGVGVDPYNGKPVVTVPDVNQPFNPVIGPDGQITGKANQPVQSFQLARGKASAPTVHNYVMPQTPGQTEADKKYAADFVDFATGGFADAMKQVEQLREASAALGSGAPISGPVLGSLPDSVLSMVNPKAMATREAVQEVAQRNLRAVLGAQFTQQEGDRLIARVFNPRLGEAENKKRADRLALQIERGAKAKLDAANYFMKHGSLVGWQGRLPKLSDFDPDFGKKEQGGATGGFEVPKRLKFNPATGQLE